MDIEKIFNELKSNICEVLFMKADGTERVMKCTLHESYLPEQIELEESIQNNTTQKTSISVWDIEKNNWRAFRTNSIMSFEVVESIK